MTPLGTCDWCARLVQLDNAGRVRRHDTVGVIVRARIGKRRRRCPGSGRWARRVEQ